MLFTNYFLRSNNCSRINVFALLSGKYASFFSFRLSTSYDLCLSRHVRARQHVNASASVCIYLSSMQKILRDVCLQFTEALPALSLF